MRQALALIVVLAVWGCKAGDRGDAPPVPVSDESRPAEPSKAVDDRAANGPDDSDGPKGPDEGAVAHDVELTAADGVSVFGRFNPPADTGDGPAPIVLLFHQARSNRAEYDPTVSWLNGLGYATLAIDQRSGGTMWERDNETVVAHGESTSFDDAYPDLEAALTWAQAQGHEKILAVGSSYTAALVFRLGAQHADDLRGIAAFSPGEYLDDPKAVGQWAKTIEVPTYAACSPQEYADVRALMKTVPATQKLLHKPKTGLHGASSLRQDTNPDGYEEYQTMFKEFLETVL